MRVDIHVHPTFYEAINADPAREALRHRVVDIHKNGLASFEHIENQMACAGLDKLTLLAQVYPESAGGTIVSNEEVCGLTAARPDLFWGMGSLDPSCADPAGEAERALGKLGLSGLSLYPCAGRFFPDDPRLEPVWQICERYDRPVLLHCGMTWEPGQEMRYGNPLAVEPLAMRHPKLRICIARFGWPWVRETTALLLKYPNLYADTGVLYFDCAREFYRKTYTLYVPATWIDRSLRRQVLFGSDNPRFEQIRMAAAMEELGLRPSTVELIMGGNALTFLGKEMV